MTLNRKVAITFVFALLASAALIAVAAAAFGSDVPVQRGAACAHVGQVAADRQGVKYICEQRTVDDCPRWHALHPAPGPWPSRSTLPCAKCSPSPSVSPSPSPSPSASTSPPASTSPSASKSPSPSGSGSTAGSPPPPGSVKTTPVADTGVLPVTGLPTVVVGIAATGALLIVSGAVLFVASLRRRRT